MAFVCKRFLIGSSPALSPTWVDFRNFLDQPTSFQMFSLFYNNVSVFTRAVSVHNIYSQETGLAITYDLTCTRVNSVNFDHCSLYPHLPRWLALEIPRTITSRREGATTELGYLSHQNCLKMSAFLVQWLQGNIECQTDGEVSLHMAFERYQSSCDSNDLVSLDSNPFAKMIKKLFPNVQRVTHMEHGQAVYYYRGISVTSSGVDTVNLNDVHHIASDMGFFKLSQDSTSITLGYNTNIICNNLNCAIKVVVFSDDGGVEVKIGKQDVSIQLSLPTQLHVTDSKFRREDVTRILKTTASCTLCQGMDYPSITNSYNSLSPSLFLEWRTFPDGSHKRLLRSLHCSAVAPFTASSSCCNNCLRAVPRILTYTQDQQELRVEDVEDDTVQLHEEDHTDLENILKSIIPQVSNDTEIKVLLQSQIDSLQRNPNGRRWPRKIIRMCLMLYGRSPKAYQQLRNEGFLILPSGRLLSSYKNAVQQKPGCNERVFRWMKKEADRIDLPQQGREGGLLMDEMAIQEDLQISRREGKMALVGFVDMGNEANIIQQLMSGNQDKCLASHVLQITFLGYTGFRFPVCHFPTSQVMGHELYSIFWEVIHYLKMWGFRVDFTCMDGASSNRKFMQIHFYGGSPLENRFTTSNIFSGDPCDMVIFMQDFSHVMKKVRNNLEKSGVQKGKKKMLAYGGKLIIWDHLMAAYTWDQSCNTFPIHEKLTPEHFELTPSSKMRNHLAEQVLDENMLHLLQEHEITTGGKSNALRSDGNTAFRMNPTEG